LGDSLIRSQTGRQFDLTKVKYEAKDTNAGKVLTNGNLSDLKSRKLIYTSDDLGSANDIAVKFMPTKDYYIQQAGRYVGVINYYVELYRTSTTVESGFIDSVDAEFEVLPIFRLIVASILGSGEEPMPEGAVLLNFNDVSVKSGSKQSAVKIKIESNLGKPYLVTQRLSGPLQNEEGYKLSDDQFTFMLKQSKDTGAKLKFDKEATVGTGKDEPLFISNSNGDNDEFEITYKLRVTSDTRGGNYSTGISYSLSEL
jgi:hypothetical protein